MGLWNWLAKKVSTAAEVGGWNVMPWQSGRPYYPDYDYKELVKKYSSWVYACAHINAISCAQIPLRLYVAKPSRKTKMAFETKSLDMLQKDYLAESASTHQYFTKSAEIEVVTEHPFLDLLSNVNEFMNGFDLLESTFLSQELVGNAYWHIIQGFNDLPSAIWPFLPQYIKIIPDKVKFIKHFEYYISSSSLEKHIIEPEAMIHFKYVNPQNSFYGLGPLQACVVAADLGFNMNLYETSLFQNRAIPDVAITIPKESAQPTQEEQKRITKQWTQRYGGIEKQGKPIWLYGGADVKQLSLSPKEMAYLAGRKASMNEIAAVFGVPVSKLTTENVNLANAEAGDYSYMKDTILPRLRKCEQKLNEQLLPMYDKSLFCAFDNPVPADKEFRLKQIESHLKTGYASINQERQLDSAEVVDWGEVPILPMAMVPFGSATPPKISPTKTKGIKAPRRLPPLGRPTNFVSEPFVRAIKAYFREQRDEILANFDSDMTKGLKISTADDYMSSWFDMYKWNGVLGERTEPFVRYTFMAGAEKSLQGLATETVFDPLNPKVMRALEMHRNGSVAQMNHATIKRLRKTLSQGIAGGESIPKLRDRLVNEYESLETYQSEVIARTETIWAWNEGAVQGYIQSGIVEKKIWVSSGDDRTCVFCPEMDGKTIDVEVTYFDKGDNFTVGEKSLNFDYEDVGHPPLHCDCRCCIAAIIEEI